MKIEKLGTAVSQGIRMIHKKISASPVSENDLSNHLSDYQLLKSVDGYLATVLGKQEFLRLREIFIKADPIVCDIGAGRSVLRGMLFLDAIQTTCVDPAYKWYKTSPEDSHKIPSGVFGGLGEKEEMAKQLNAAITNANIPTIIGGRRAHLVTGTRNDKKRTISLLPEDGSEWLSKQKQENIPNMIVWRTFPSSEDWGKIVASLKIGGFLITTGFGRAEGISDYEKITSGIDIYNSPLPQNGNSGILGLRPLTDPRYVPDIYFYQKMYSLPAETLANRIRKSI